MVQIYDYWFIDSALFLIIDVKKKNDHGEANFLPRDVIMDSGLLEKIKSFFFSI